jgi:hypothetical protein
MAGVKSVGVRPPSICRVVPVTELARGLARKAMTDATSSGEVKPARHCLAGLGRLQRVQAAGGVGLVGCPAWGAFMIG